MEIFKKYVNALYVDKFNVEEENCNEKNCGVLYKSLRRSPM